jgi:hypothetical protein
MPPSVTLRGVAAALRTASSIPEVVRAEIIRHISASAARAMAAVLIHAAVEERSLVVALIRWEMARL